MATQSLVFSAQILELGVKAGHPDPQITEGGIMGIVAHFQRGVMVRFEHLQLRLMLIPEPRHLTLVMSGAHDCAWWWGTDEAAGLSS